MGLSTNLGALTVMDLGVNPKGSMWPHSWSSLRITTGRGAFVFSHKRTSADQVWLAPAWLQPDVGGVRADLVSAQASDKNLHAPAKIMTPSQNPGLIKFKMTEEQSNPLHDALKYNLTKDPPVNLFFLGRVTLADTYSGGGNRTLGGLNSAQNPRCD